jgi:hypothetical protein
MDDPADSTPQVPAVPAALVVPAIPVVPAASGWRNLREMLYPDLYAWFILFSAMDVMLTWVIRSIGGSEANPIARLVIDAWELPGAIAFKFSLTLAVIVICEIVGRQRDRVARFLIQLAIVVSITPVLYSITLLAAHVVHL